MNGGDCGNNGISSTVTSWSADENQLLIKAVTIFPPGSQIRYGNSFDKMITTSNI